MISAPRIFGTVVPPSQKKLAWVPEALEFFGTLKGSIMKSFGPGRLPLYHYTNLGDSKVRSQC